MVIDQRNAGASVTPTDGAYTLDRWRSLQSVASKYSVQQNAGSVTPPAGFTNYLGVTSLSAYTVGASDTFSTFQVIEGFNSADLDFGKSTAKTITISFWVRSSLTGTFGGSLRNFAGNRSYPFTYTISSANTWEYETITIAGDTSGSWVGATNSGGLYLFFGLGVGTTSSGTAGAWAAGNFISATGATSVVGTNGATFYITGVQLEVGTQATSFEYRQYTTELQLCQRYFQKSYDTGSAVPTINTVVGSVAMRNSATTGNNTPFWGITFRTTMRGTPTVTTYSYDGTAGAIGGPSNATVTATTYQQGNNGFNVANTSGSSVSLGDYYCNWAATAEL
jgi:hypothetical protein